MAAAVEDDPEIRARLAEVRPDLDPIVLSVMQANARAALFGNRPTIEVGRYELLREVGTGGGGSVFVARDPELDREIAIKLVVAATDELRTRAFSEGQALARLSHPNIVPVFDVGVQDERVYLVMELVRGESLRRYAEGATVPQIVSAYRQAGHGLAAAHEARLVHRDFKPDNAVIGTDGRVRVIDFGLARPATENTPGRSGTPRYMAPEQLAGQPATAASDQYAFAMSLREAVGEPLPRWLDAVVRRGGHEDPTARFRDMSALLRALANDPRRRWRRRALVAAPITFAIAGFALGRGGDEEPPPCNGAAALATTWTPDGSTELQAEITKLGTPFAAISAPRAKEAIDRYANRWIASYNAGCVASRRKEPMADRRAACVAGARAQLAETIHLLAGVTPETLPSMMSALSELPDLGRCADETALVEALPPPPPAHAHEIGDVAVELDRAQVSVNAARPEAVSRTSELVERARTLGYKPLLARALLANGHAELAIGERDRAIAPLAEATDLALSVGDVATGVEAYARAAWAKAMTGTDPATATQGLGLVAALAKQLGPRDRFSQALLHNNAGTIENMAGHRDSARRHFEMALGLARDVVGPGQVEISAVRSNLALVTDVPAERDRLLAERVAILRAQVGDEHPLTLKARVAAAANLEDDASARDALRIPCETFARLHPAHGASIVECASELVWLQLATGDTAAARQTLQLVLTAQGGDIDTYSVDVARGYAAMLDGDLEVARTTFDGLAARFAPNRESVWWELLRAGDIELARVSVARAGGRRSSDALQRAIRYLERAAAARPLPMIMRRLAWARRITDPRSD